MHCYDQKLTERTHRMHTPKQNGGGKMAKITQLKMAPKTKEISHQ